MTTGSTKQIEELFPWIDQFTDELEEGAARAVREYASSLCSFDPPCETDDEYRGAILGLLLFSIRSLKESIADDLVVDQNIEELVMSIRRRQNQISMPVRSNPTAISIFLPPSPSTSPRKVKCPNCRHKFHV